MNEQLAGLSPDRRDALRLAGAVLFATGIFVLLLRKGEDWADLPVLLVLLVPCVLLYGLGIAAVRVGPGDDREPVAADRVGAGARADHAGLPAWRATSLVLGILFVPFVLFQLIELIGGDSGKPGWVFIVLVLSAGAAAYAAARHALRYGALLAGLFLIGAWLALCDALFDPDATTVRWLFIIIGALLAAAAWRLHRDNRREAPELVTAAGIAGLAAGVTAFAATAGILFQNALASAFGTDEDGASGGIEQRQEWDAFLLILAVALIWYGARAAWRGPVYVGGIALVAFIVSTGAQLSDQVSGEEPSGDVMGWPILLLLLGAAALAAGLLAGKDRGGRGDAGATAVMPPAGGMTPDAPGGPASPGSPGATPPPGSVPPPGSPPPGQP